MIRPATTYTQNTFAPISFQSPLTDEQLGTIIVGKMVFEVMLRWRTKHLVVNKICEKRKLRSNKSIHDHRHIVEFDGCPVSS